jgi:hypothetical protein
MRLRLSENGKVCQWNIDITLALRTVDARPETRYFRSEEFMVLSALSIRLAAAIIIAAPA